MTLPLLPGTTECRLSAAAMGMVAEVGEETVDFRPTYDGEGLEPSVLPAAFPNLLVNGTTGIAVGMATNMAPHNLREIGAAVELVLHNEAPGEDDDADSAQARSGLAASNSTTTDDLLRIVPGPDFPGGGRIVGQGMRQVCESGRGPVRVQARVKFEQVTRRRQAIIITELPYQVGAERVVAKITKLMEAGRLPDVAGVADLTDADGCAYAST